MKHAPTIREESLRTQIALAAITALLTLCWMLVFMITESALADNGFHALHGDPGRVSSIIFIVPLYALIPVYVYLVGNLRPRVFRWILVALAGLAFVFWILHHLSHWQFGQRPTFGSHIVDLTLHVVGLWMLVNSIKWAKLPPPAREIDRASVAHEMALRS